jgi:hypothetical protein
MEGMFINEGYAAVNISADPGDNSKNRWIGVIQGNIYCKKVYKKPYKALRDAKKLYQKLIINAK